MARTYISTDRLRQVFKNEDREEIIKYLKYHHHKMAHKNSWLRDVVKILVKAGYRVRPTHYRGLRWRYQDADFIITLTGAVRLNVPTISTEGWTHAGARCVALGYKSWIGYMKDVNGEMRFIFGWKGLEDGRVELFTDAGFMYPDANDILHY